MAVFVLNAAPVSTNIETALLYAACMIPQKGIEQLKAFGAVVSATGALKMTFPASEFFDECYWSAFSSTEIGDEEPDFRRFELIKKDAALIEPPMVDIYTDRIVLSATPQAMGPLETSRSDELRFDMMDIITSSAA